MRRAIFFCLILVACQNQNEERIKNLEKEKAALTADLKAKERIRKLEKEVADLKGNPSAEKVDAPVPVPAPAVPAPEMDHPIRKDVAAGLVERQLAAYVPTKDNAVYGLVTEISPGRTVLYRLEGDLYQVVNQVSENVTVDGLTVVSDEQMVRLQGILVR